MNSMISRILNELKEQKKSQKQLAQYLGVTQNVITDWKSGRIKSYTKYLHAIADYLGVSVAYLKGETDIKERYPAPKITTDVVTFPVLGEIAAGYNTVPLENWDGDVVDVPTAYLKGRQQEEYFVLRVKGDSMYPFYHSGDKVLILKQDILDRSGQIAAVLYDSEYATLKRVDYDEQKGWLRLNPANPAYPPTLIEGEDINRCHIIGIPKLLIREIEE